MFGRESLGRSMRCNGDVGGDRMVMFLLGYWCAIAPNLKAEAVASGSSHTVTNRIHSIAQTGIEYNFYNVA
jgi:hypothetical protein